MESWIWKNHKFECVLYFPMREGYIKSESLNENWIKGFRSKRIFNLVKEWAKNLAIRKHRLMQAKFLTGGGEMNVLHEGW